MINGIKLGPVSIEIGEGVLVSIAVAVVLITALSMAFAGAADWNHTWAATLHCKAATP